MARSKKASAAPKVQHENPKKGVKGWSGTLENKTTERAQNLEEDFLAECRDSFMPRIEELLEEENQQSTKCFDTIRLNSIEASTNITPRLKIEDDAYTDIYDATPRPAANRNSSQPRRRREKSTAQLTTPAASPHPMSERYRTSEPRPRIKSESVEERQVAGGTSYGRYGTPKSSPEGNNMPNLPSGKSRYQSEMPYSPKARAAQTPNPRNSYGKGQQLFPSDMAVGSSGPAGNSNQRFDIPRGRSKRRNRRSPRHQNFTPEAARRETLQRTPDNPRFEPRPNSVSQCLPSRRLSRVNSRRDPGHDSFQGVRNKREDSGKGIHHGDDIKEFREVKPSKMYADYIPEIDSTQRYVKKAERSIKVESYEKLANGRENAREHDYRTARAHNTASDPRGQLDEERYGFHTSTDPNRDVTKHRWSERESEMERMSSRQVDRPNPQLKRSWGAYNEKQTFPVEEEESSDDDLVEIDRELFKESLRKGGKRRRHREKVDDQLERNGSRISEQTSQEDSDGDCVATLDYASKTSAGNDEPSDTDQLPSSCNYPVHSYFDHGEGIDGDRAEDGFVDFKRFKVYCLLMSQPDEGLSLRFKRDLMHFLKCEHHRKLRPGLHLVAQFARKNPCFTLRSTARKEETRIQENEAIGVEPDKDTGKPKKLRGRTSSSASTESQGDIDELRQTLNVYRDGLSKLAAQTKILRKRLKAAQKDDRQESPESS